MTSELSKKLKQIPKHESQAKNADLELEEINRQQDELDNNTEISTQAGAKKAAELGSQELKVEYISKSSKKRVQAALKEIKQLYDEGERSHADEEKAQKKARRELASADMEADTFQPLIDRAKATYHLLDSAHYLEWQAHVLSYFPKTYDRQEGAKLAAELFPDAPQLPEYPDELQQARRLLDDVEQAERERMFPARGRVVS